MAALASRQHGVVTRTQLLDAGVTEKEVRSRLERGSLLRVHRGVYRVGHSAPSVEASYLAAVLAAGEGAALGGRAAAYLWGILKGAAPPPEVLCPAQRRIEGVKTRRVRQLASADIGTCRGIPVTTVARTLVDLASVLSDQYLARTCHEAGVRYRTTPREVASVLARSSNAPGSGRLRRVLRGDVRVVLSKLEARFVKLLREHGLPLPVTNRPAGGRRVDCRWPEHGLTVELDSYRFHNSRQAWELDRRREREARARGDDFRRYTYGDVTETPGPMLRELEAFFSAGGPPPQPRPRSGAAFAEASRAARAG